MNTKRPGCFTIQGTLAALITLLAIAGISLARGGVLFNPGELNAQTGQTARGGVFSHAETGGRCNACHVPFWQRLTMDDRCKQCHTEVFEGPKDFHRVMLAESTETACAGCHTEHRGADAALTIVDLEHFPHDQIGFSLQAHKKQADGSPFTCDACHASDFTRFDQANCAQCHSRFEAALIQSHREQFGDSCLACHNGSDRFASDFDHSQLAFVLSGRHAGVECAACHHGARDLAGMAAASTDCWSCHRQDDAHQGQLGADCQACHSPEGWQAAVFDHSQSAFALTGEHVEVACRDCHLPDPGSADAVPVFAGTPQDCSTCHAADDAHQSQYGMDCGQCHTPAGWQPASFDHSLVAFPLTGAHLMATCSGCHAPGPGGLVFKGTPQQCSACHSEPQYHASLFAADCQTCHTTDGWSPARFDSPHTFPINHGESGPSECKVCHPAQLQAYNCYGCHEHPEVEIAAEHIKEGIRDFQDCARCHPTGQKEEGGDD